MGVEENKAVVRRFIENVVSGRDVSVADEVLAPDYVNLPFPNGDIALTRGRIDVDDVMMVPDLHDVLGSIIDVSVW